MTKNGDKIWVNTALGKSLLPDDTSGHFYKQGFTLIPACISNYMAREVWDEITYPLLNCNGCNCWSLGMDK